MRYLLYIPYPLPTTSKHPRIQRRSLTAYIKKTSGKIGEILSVQRSSLFKMQKGFVSLLSQH